MSLRSTGGGIGYTMVVVRRRISGWLAEVPPVLAGFVGVGIVFGITLIPVRGGIVGRFENFFINGFPGARLAILLGLISVGLVGRGENGLFSSCLKAVSWSIVFAAVGLAPLMVQSQGEFYSSSYGAGILMLTVATVFEMPFVVFGALVGFAIRSAWEARMRSDFR